MSDQGCGISDEDKAHVFDRFYRADSSRTERQHYGLGLSIAWELVRLHGGTLTVGDAGGRQGGFLYQAAGVTWTLSFSSLSFSSDNFRKFAETIPKWTKP